MAARATVNTSPNFPSRNYPKKPQKLTHLKNSQHHEWVLEKRPTMAMYPSSRREGVTVYKEEDVLITWKIKPIIIGRLDECGRHPIPLTQDYEQWQACKPTRKAKKYLQQTKSVYDLPSTEEAIKLIRVVCGYPVKSTWIKAIKSGKYIGWPMIT